MRVKARYLYLKDQYSIFRFILLAFLNAVSFGFMGFGLVFEFRVPIFRLRFFTLQMFSVTWPLRHIGFSWIHLSRVQQRLFLYDYVLSTSFHQTIRKHIIKQMFASGSQPIVLRSLQRPFLSGFSHPVILKDSVVA